MQTSRMSACPKSRHPAQKLGIGDAFLGKAYQRPSSGTKFTKNICPLTSNLNSIPLSCTRNNKSLV